MLKQTLEQAYAQIPQDFAYREVKFYLYHAIQRLNAVEDKEAKKDAQNKEWQRKDEERRKKFRPTVPGGMDVRQTLNIIDEMINVEKNIISEIQRRKGRNIVDADEPPDDEGAQTFHG